ncbi:hypothetical protein ACS126_09985 [Sphingobacterium lactis]|uniref:hypothetical protein n=1 Tax=Sphingobacterium lactis TaxID=797291 RepID=UPI003EC6491B
MKTFLFTITILSVTLTTLAQDYGKISDLDKKNGFKTLVLGDSITNFENYKFLGDVDENVKMFDVKEIDHKIGDIELTAISIITFDNKISKIVAFFDKKDGYKIHGVFDKAYGVHSQKPNRFIDKYVWNGSKVDLILDYDNLRKDGTMMFISLSLLKAEKDANNIKRNKAVSDL